MITVKKLICLFSLDQISSSVDNSSAPCLELEFKGSRLNSIILDPTLYTKSMLVDKIRSSKISRSSVYYIINIIDQQFTR